MQSKNRRFFTDFHSPYCFEIGRQESGPQHELAADCKECAYLTVAAPTFRASLATPATATKSPAVLSTPLVARAPIWQS